MEQIISNNADETRKFAKTFAEAVKKGIVLCFYGNLGSGKTTFIQSLARGLGVKKRIISPTFIIVRSYKIEDGFFYHIDLYRTSSLNDLKSVGIDQILKDKNSIVAIEWADKLGELLPSTRIDLSFENLDNDKRKITINRYE